MDKIKQGLFSFVLAFIWWLTDRLYGDELFRIIRQHIPKKLRTLDGLSDAALQSMLSFGPPVVLNLLGSWLIYKGWKHMSGKNAKDEAYGAEASKLSQQNSDS
ncbi:MAG: hypothetical protein B7Y80_04655 [Hyphomicrobium sp. 32-62-53]|nr:MAG: hypothetical protein B7Z29_05615 [Hyphomicrobium sp. 12-62-95]OYY01193.1 MAG: hypothetical protein B7Y80_04655 [Hyphomicrobium sp. 32-62-53]